MHSAAWDNDYDFSGKRVACIGIGSSGIQIVPQLAKGTISNVLAVFTDSANLFSASREKYGLFRTHADLGQPSPWDQRTDCK